MTRKPAPTKAHSDAKSSKPATATEHPALTLFHALNALHTVCSNAGAFRELAERRAHASRLQMAMLRTMSDAEMRRPEAKSSTGAASAEDCARIIKDKLAPIANAPPPSNEPAEYTKSLREDVLDHGRAWCERARAAMRVGGAKGLDAATHPNAAGQARSIELHTKLQDAERVFVGLTIGVGNPRIIIDQDAENMAALGEWFASTRDELRAVIETRGLDAPAPTPTVSVSPELLDRLEAASGAAEKMARVFGAGDNGDTKPKTLPAGADESAGPALTVNQSRVLQTMARFDASRLLSSKMIAEEMDGTVRLAEETVRQCVGKLIALHLAERPEGERSGARLTTAGRKLAGKIAD